MEKFNELLEKRKNLTATIFEEEELIRISKKLSESQLSGVDKRLLTHSHSERVNELAAKIDELIDNL